MQKKDKILKILMFILFINLPVLDILRATTFKDIELFGVSIMEMVNIVLIGLSFAITLTKCNKKNFIVLGIYFLLVGLYIVLHYSNMMKFDQTIYLNTNFNFIKETVYIIRVYLLPIIVLFILIKNKNIFDLKFYSSVIKCIIVFISFNIIILDILKLSYPSYDDIVNFKFVPHSIFGYLNYDGDPQNLLAKGWFDSANEISIILFTLLPINIFLLYKENKINNIIIFISQLFSMIILGTRTSAYGSILIPGVCLFMYLFFVIIKKMNFDLKFFVKYTISLGIICIIFIISPFKHFKREIDPSRLEVHNSEKLSILLNENKTDEERSIAIENSLYNFGIHPDVEELYPVENDLPFWISICNRELKLNNDLRILKRDVIKRIKFRNNNFKDTLFGMGLTLNFLDIETDYVHQYYLFGIFGIALLMGVYFISYISSIVLFFKQFHKKFKFEYILLFMPAMLELIVAYFSGHTFGCVTPTLVLSMILGLLNYSIVGDVND